MVDPETETLVILKPDCVRRALVGEAISRIERKGLQITKIKTCTLSPATVNDHYKEHVGKHFYTRLVDHMHSGPVYVLVVSGDNVISVMRELTTWFRNEYCNVQGPDNLMHASDSPAAAMREIDLHF